MTGFRNYRGGGLSRSKCLVISFVSLPQFSICSDCMMLCIIVYIQVVVQSTSFDKYTFVLSDVFSVSNGVR